MRVSYNLSSEVMELWKIQMPGYRTTYKGPKLSEIQWCPKVFATLKAPTLESSYCQAFRRHPIWTATKTRSSGRSSRNKINHLSEDLQLLNTYHPGHTTERLALRLACQLLHANDPKEQVEMEKKLLRDALKMQNQRHQTSSSSVSPESKISNPEAGEIASPSLNSVLLPEIRYVFPRVVNFLVNSKLFQQVQSLRFQALHHKHVLKLPPSSEIPTLECQDNRDFTKHLIKVAKALKHLPYRR